MRVMEERVKYVVVHRTYVALQGLMSPKQRPKRTNMTLSSFHQGCLIHPTGVSSRLTVHRCRVESFTPSSKGHVRSGRPASCASIMFLFSDFIIAVAWLLHLVVLLTASRTPIALAV
jgi:hypothetical protein